MIFGGSSTTDLRASVQLSMAPANCISSQCRLDKTSLTAHLLHASVCETLAGTKEAVATAGMACDTVVEAATEDALEVTMV